jgi:hypothetical protein
MCQVSGLSSRILDEDIGADLDTGLPICLFDIFEAKIKLLKLKLTETFLESTFGL